MRRTTALASAIALCSLAAQAPAQTPLPTRTTFSVETINIKSIDLAQGSSGLRVTYTRAGTKPNEFRISEKPTLDGVAWRPFTEGTVTTQIIDKITWTTGTATTASPPATGACGQNTVKIKAYFQFRGVNKSLQKISSNIASDSLCIPFG